MYKWFERMGTRNAIRHLRQMGHHEYANTLAQSLKKYEK